MSKTNSEYRFSALRKLPPGLLGSETYSIVTATEVKADLIKAEYYLLVQRPNIQMIHGMIELNMKNFPAELERWNISFALDEAQLQVEIEVGTLLEARATALNRVDLAYLPFEFKSAGVSLMSPWTRGLFGAQIIEILNKTESPKLKLYLGFLIQNTPIR